MELTTLTLGARQRLVLENLLEQGMDVWFDRSADECDAKMVGDIQALADIFDKLDMTVPKEVRLFLAEKRG